MNRVLKAIVVLMQMIMVVLVIGCVETDGSKTNTSDFVVPEGGIDGAFTINKEGNRVCFSQGNLQYNPNSGIWRFAENQYDLLVTEREMTFTNPYNSRGFERVAIVTSNYSKDYDGWIDLFGWGTSGWNSGVKAFYPYDTCHYSDYLNKSLTDEFANADWGVFNSISNGGNDVGLWRTLTRDEWDYICNKRRTDSGIRFVKATVSGVKGVVLVPDNWKKDKCKIYKHLGIVFDNEKQDMFELYNHNKSDSAFDSNVISSSSWSLLEISGCVFLPAAGFRLKDIIESIGYLGAYWSSTTYDNVAAYCASFTESEFTPTNRFFRQEGLSVRLVAPLE